MSHQDWICKEIEKWQKEGIIDDSVATNLHTRYAANKSRISWGVIIAGAFGALLLGLGIIALFAANWDCFGRGARAIIAMTPLVVCGILAMIAAHKKMEGMSFWEPLGIFWTIATCAATCLVAQTYQLSGSLSSLILLCAVLTLPIVWVTHSVTMMGLWPLWAVVWTFSILEDIGDMPFLWVKSALFIVISIPAYIAFLRRKKSNGVFVTGQLIAGLVYTCGVSAMTVALIPNPPHNIVLDVGICIFWFYSAVVFFVGQHYKLPIWPMLGTIVAACAALPSVFSDSNFSVAFSLSIILAIAIIVFGIRKMKLSYTNIGAILLLWLLLAKFFESDVSFTIKGLVFICAGTLLIAANVSLAKMSNRSIENENK